VHVIQGSAIGRALFIVIATDLEPVHAGTVLVEFADKRRIIVSAGALKMQDMNTFFSIIVILVAICQLDFYTNILMD